MNAHDTLFGLRRPRRAPRLATSALAPILLVASMACAPRQAVVQSERNPGVAASVGVEVLRADLRELTAAQEEFAADHGYYASRESELNFTSSSGGRVDIIQGDRNGWSAVASSGEDECGVFQGDVRPPRGYLVESGRVECRSQGAPGR